MPDESGQDPIIERMLSERLGGDHAPDLRKMVRRRAESTGKLKDRSRRPWIAAAATLALGGLAWQLRSNSYEERADAMAPPQEDRAITANQIASSGTGVQEHREARAPLSSARHNEFSDGLAGELWVIGEKAFAKTSRSTRVLNVVGLNEDSLPTLTEFRDLEWLCIDQARSSGELWRRLIATPFQKLRKLKIVWSHGIDADAIQSLAHQPSLVELAIEGIQIDSAMIDALSGLRRLKSLRLYRSSFADDASLQPLAALAALEALTINPSHANDDEMRSVLGNMPGLRRLDLTYARGLSGDWLQEGMLPELEALSYSHGKILRGSFLESLAGHPALVSLELVNMPLSDKKLARLQRLPSLESLMLGGCEDLQGRSLSVLDLPKLKRLSLRGCSVDDEALANMIDDHARIEVLRLDHCRRLSSRALQGLDRLPALRELGLSFVPGADNDVLAALRGHSSLRRLDLYRSAVNDGSIESLLSLESLEALRVGETGLSDSALRRLSTQVEELQPRAPRDRDRDDAMPKSSSPQSPRRR